MQPPSEEPLARRAGAARSQMRCTLGIFPLTPREAIATASAALARHPCAYQAHGVHRIGRRSLCTGLVLACRGRVGKSQPAALLRVCGFRPRGQKLGLF